MINRISWQSTPTAQASQIAKPFRFRFENNRTRQLSFDLVKELLRAYPQQHELFVRQLSPLPPHELCSGQGETPNASFAEFNLEIDVRWI